MRKLVKYINHQPRWRKLPRMPRDYSTDWQAKDVDRETATLMMQSHTRCPQGVKVLEKRHNSEARTLIRTLPPRRYKRDRRGRVLSLLRRVFGLMKYDPMQQYAREHERRTR